MNIVDDGDDDDNDDDDQCSRKRVQQLKQMLKVTFVYFERNAKKLSNGYTVLETTQLIRSRLVLSPLRPTRTTRTNPSKV